MPLLKSNEEAVDPGRESRCFFCLGWRIAGGGHLDRNCLMVCVIDRAFRGHQTVARFILELIPVDSDSTLNYARLAIHRDSPGVFVSQCNGGF